MNRLVYLFELDSVRNSLEEVKRGQEALFREIVLNGNTVVLSFNQLTDSDAFLNLLKDDKTYDEIIALFKNGAIKVSRYGDYRTPSQYIQDALDKCIAKDDNTFLFSGLPVRSTEKELLQVMKNALQYNDIGSMEELLDEAKKCYTNAKRKGDKNKQDEMKKEQDRLEFLIRYIKMLLVLSVETLADNPPRTGPGKSFTKFMENMLSVDYDTLVLQANVQDEQVVDVMKAAVQLLNAIYIDMQEKQKQGLQSRSCWINEVNADKNSNKDVKHMAIAMIDICYNFTIEYSIRNSSKHYNVEEQGSFEKEYISRLYAYWQDFQNGIHVATSDNDDSKCDIATQMHWITAVRVVEANRKKDKKTGREDAYEWVEKKDDEKLESELLYNVEYEKEKRIWNRKLVWNILKQLFYTVVYIVLFCVVQWIMEALEELVSGTHILEGFWYDVVVSMILFGILGSIVSEVTGLPDILDSMKNIGRGIADAFRIIRMSGKEAKESH